MIKILAVAAVLFILSTEADDVSANMSEEFRLIAKTYHDLVRYDVAVDVRYGVGRPVAPIHAEVKCIDTNRCIRMIGTLTVLQTPLWSIAIDEARHSMTIARRSVGIADAQSSKDPDELLVGWLKTGGKVTGGELSPEGRHWSFITANGRQLQAEVYSDPNTHLLRKLVYNRTVGDAGTGRVEISYVWNDPSNLNPVEFDETRYIVEQGDDVSPASAYANYSIIRADRH
jgi:hypothetical protein